MGENRATLIRMQEKLLIVDDDASVRKLLRRLLEAEGYAVIEADDGRAGADLVKSAAPALVLLDIHMAGLDGIAALDAILDCDPHIRVIMVTGDGDAARAKAAMDRGACDYLTKPFNSEVLKNSVMANLLVRR